MLPDNIKNNIRLLLRHGDQDCHFNDAEMLHALNLQASTAKIIQGRHFSGDGLEREVTNAALS